MAWTPKCTGCAGVAVTRDGRALCIKCLRKAINNANPIIERRRRTQDEKEDTFTEPSPWGENAVRALEEP